MTSLIDIEKSFPVSWCLPKQSTGASLFLTKYPQYDGRNVKMAILDTGVDPLANGLQKTSMGDVKLIDLRDSSGSGDVDISTIVQISSNSDSNQRFLQGISGRKLKIPSNWINPSGEFHLGIKSLKQLFPSTVFDRLIKERREKLFDPEHRRVMNEAQRRLDEHLNQYPTLLNEDEKLIREDLQSIVESLKDIEKKYCDPGPFFDCLVWNDGQKWISCIDTSEQGILDQCQCLTSYRDSHEIATFTSIDMVNYSVEIHHQLNILEIVVAGGSHGTHVAAIASAFIDQSSEENGIAPGTQILSINIGDHRLSTMETIPSLVRAIKYCIDYQVDIINMSYGEDCHLPNSGRLQQLFNEVVEKHGIIFVSSAGNNGPALSTTGAPGATCSNLIGVGGYVTPEMQLAEYSLRQSTGSTLPFTWSSRGPNSDGWLGVSISAPGAAITSVPQFSLCQRQLMNGTSMASPNAAGCIALLLSALKEEEIEYNPFLIRSALENCAQKCFDCFSVGCGLIQIHLALDLIRSLSRPSFLSNIYFEIVGGQGRGIYLREFDQVQQSSGDIRLTIKTKFFSKQFDQFTSFEDQKKKINYSSRLSLLCDPPVNYVQHGKCVDLSFQDRTFDIRLDPSILKDDQIYFTQLQFFDINQIHFGPLIRFPITIIKPMRILNVDQPLEYRNQIFQSGEIRRHFLEVPFGSQIAMFRIRNNSFDHSSQMNLHFIQLEMNRSFRLNEFEKLIRLNPQSTFQCYFLVQQKRTLELCLARWWSSLTNISFDYSIQFSSLILNPSSIHFSSSQSYQRIDLENHFPLTIYEISGLPFIQWKSLVQTLRPNKEQSKIQILSSRDCFPQQRQIYQLILVFQFNLLKSSEITVKSPLFHEYLYDNEYEAALWMCFDTNKQYLGAGDVIKDYSLKLEKGDYFIRMQIRHEKVDQLEKLLKENFVSLHLEHKMTNLPSTDFYSSFDHFINQKKKLSPSTIKISSTNPISIFFAPIHEDKIPKIISNISGTFLRGTIHFPLNEQMKKLEMSSIVQYFTEPIVQFSSSSSSSKKSFSPSTTTTTTTTTTKKCSSSSSLTTDELSTNVVLSKEQQYEEALRDLKMSWMPKLLDDQRKIYDEMLNENGELNRSIQFQMFRLQQLENQSKQIRNQQEKDEKLNEIIRFIDQTIHPLIDQNSISQFFGQKNISNSLDKEIQSIKSEMEKRRNWFIETLISLGNSLCDLSKLNEENQQRLNELIVNLSKHLDLNDSKLNHFLIKFYSIKKMYGKVWKILQKQLEDKSSSQQQQDIDHKLIQLYEKLHFDHLVQYHQRLIIGKYPRNYLLF